VSDGIEMTLRTWADYEQPVAYGVIRDVEHPAHGTLTGYVDFGCRCDLCASLSARWQSRAERKHRRTQRQARKKRRGW